VRAKVGKVLRASFERHLRRCFPLFGKGRPVRQGSRLYSAPVADRLHWHVCLEVSRIADDFGVMTSFTLDRETPATTGGLVVLSALDPPADDPDTWVSVPSLWLRQPERHPARGAWTVAHLWHIVPERSIADEERHLAWDPPSPPSLPASAGGGRLPQELELVETDHPTRAIESCARHAVAAVVHHGLPWVTAAAFRQGVRLALEPQAEIEAPALEPGHLPTATWTPPRTREEAFREFQAVADGVYQALEPLGRLALPSARRRDDDEHS
jgi:hypothetical protein